MEKQVIRFRLISVPSMLITIFIFFFYLVSLGGEGRIWLTLANWAMVPFAPFIIAFIAGRKQLPFGLLYYFDREHETFEGMFVLACSGITGIWLSWAFCYANNLTPHFTGILLIILFIIAFMISYHFLMRGVYLLGRYWKE